MIPHLTPWATNFRSAIFGGSTGPNHPYNCNPVGCTPHSGLILTVLSGCMTWAAPWDPLVSTKPHLSIYVYDPFEFMITPCCCKTQAKGGPIGSKISGCEPWSYLGTVLGLFRYSCWVSRFLGSSLTIHLFLWGFRFKSTGRLCGMRVLITIGSFIWNKFDLLNSLETI